MTETKTFKCPACNAPLVYDGVAEKLTCRHCGAEIDRAAFLDEEDLDGNAARSWDKYGEGKADWSDSDVTLFICSSCGGEIICEGNTAATICPYCDNPTLIEGRLSGAFRPDVVLPFTVSAEEAKAALKKFCRHKPLLPRSFHTENKTESLKGIYIPFWLFDCDTNSRFTFSAMRKTHWRAGDYLYTRTSYYRLLRRGLLNFENIPVDGSVAADNAMLESIEPFRFEDAVPYTDALLAGHLAQRYDDSAEHCSERAHERVGKSVEASIRNTIFGYLAVRKTSEDIVFTKNDVRYALLPVWFMNTRYRDKNYTFVINGQTGKMSGSLPVSRGKFFGLLAGFSALFSVAAALIALLALML